jgi:uncharacterized protein YwqG
LLGRYRLEPYESAIVAAQLPSIRLVPSRANSGTLAIGASRLGGYPDMPPRAQWPAHNGEPLAFVAQINLAELSAFPCSNILPPTGWLYFFYDREHMPDGTNASRRGWKVLHHDGNTNDLRRLSTAQASDALPLCAIAFKPDTTFDTKCPRALTEEPGFSWQRDLDYDGFRLDAREVLRRDDKPLHRLLGHPDRLQKFNLGESCQEASTGVIAPLDTTAAASPDWRLLLQLDADRELKCSWGDGRLFFLIRSAELASRSFDNVWAIREYT